jgi:cytochrome oxidase Cu insertion factor (SCO1/SenC/PrrC family)
MKAIKTIVMIAVVAVLSLSLLAGCGTSATDPGSTPPVNVQYDAGGISLDSSSGEIVDEEAIKNAPEMK